MRKAPAIKKQLLNALAQCLDEPLRSSGFERSKSSLVFTREVGEAIHKITLTFHSNPKYQPDAEVHIYPSFQICMPKVSDASLILVEGDKLLLANAPDIIIGQPIEFAAPKDKRIKWFATGDIGFITACDSIKAFIFEWLIPFLKGITSPLDLVRLYETDDTRILKLEHWHVHVAAAYQVLGIGEKAREVVLKHFDGAGSRKRFASLFQALGMN